MDAPAMVRVALESRLGQFDSFSGRSGRQHYRMMHGDISASTVTERLNDRREMGLRSEEFELIGIMPAGSVSRYAARLGLRTERRAMRSIGPGWWERLAKSANLGVGAPSFRSKEDVILTGHAFVENLYQQSQARGVSTAEVARGLDSHSASQDSATSAAAAQELLQFLSDLACAPYGVADEAYEILTELAAAFPSEIVELARHNPMGGKLVRCLDRAMRQSVQDGGAQLRRNADTLLASPPERIMFRRIWIRAIRRVLWSARRRDHTGEHRWAIKQLAIAMHGERGYTWATETDRRYALWVLAEFAAPSGELGWPTIVGEVGDDPSLVALLADAEEGRSYLADRNNPNHDLVMFRPKGRWHTSAPLGAALETYCSRSVVGSDKARKRDIWAGWASPPARKGLATMLWEAVTTPCAIRLRTCADGILASGPRARDAASTITTEMLLDGVLGSGDSWEAERCVWLLGYFRSQMGVDALEEVLRHSESEQVVRTAIIAAGNLWASTPEARPRLTGYVQSATTRMNTEASYAAAMYAAVAEQRMWWKELPTDSWLTSTMHDWCEANSAPPF